VKGAPTAPLAGGNVIDQKGCLYQPYVIGIVKGQKVRVKNSDPTAHNVRAMNGDEQLFNEMHIAQAPDKLMSVDAAPGSAVQLKCDIHPWMETWVYVSDSSLYAVTGEGGKFSLAGVPAGSYELEVWHPHLGKKTAKITVKAGETTTATIPAFGPADYKAPQ
jgi:plastocyanin